MTRPDEPTTRPDESTTTRPDEPTATRRDTAGRERSHGEYTIRRADEDDVPAFLDLRSSVFKPWPPDDARKVFEWKYASAPAVDELPVLVVESGDGDVVGARGYFALEMSVGGERYLGLQSDDLMVHPDHRRQGLFREMNAFGLELFGAGPGTPFLFTFGWEKARKGYEKQGWEIVENNPAVRPRLGAGSVHVPTAVSGPEIAKTVGFPLYGLALGLQDRLAPPSIDRVTVHDEPPVDELVSLYEHHVPDRIHAVRSEAFYEWRLRDPLVTYITALAHREGRVAAAVVASTRPDDEILRVREVLPFRGADDAVRAALAGAMADAADSARQVDAWVPPSRRRTFLRNGFVTKEPVPWIPTGDDRIVTRPIDGEWERNGVRFADPDAWALQLLERAH